MRRTNFDCLSNFILILIFLFQVIPAKAQSPDIQKFESLPKDEKRSSIHTTDGYAYLSENMTLSQTRAAAFADARRLALEAAQTYVRSKTKVKDFQVEYDLIWTEAEGAVRILEQKDFGIEENKRYHVWIKAEVFYALNPKSPEINQIILLDESGPLTVRVWSDKKQFKTFENIQIYLQGSRNFYARIVNITPNGDIIQILPNDYRKNNYFEGGRVYKIPGEQDKYKLKVTPPYGEELIVVYASEAPLGEVALDTMGSGLKQFRGTQNELAMKTRSIKPIFTEAAPDKGSEFYETTFRIVTIP